MEIMDVAHDVWKQAANAPFSRIPVATHLLFVVLLTTNRKCPAISKEKAAQAPGRFPTLLRVKKVIERKL